MNYLDLGYDPLLSKTTNPNLKITQANVDAVVSSGAIGYDQTSLKIISGNQTIKSNNFVGGKTGWIIRGDGSAEFQSLAAGEFVHVYSQDDEPTGDISDGDIWYDTDDGNKRYRYNGSSWEVDTSNANWSAVIDDNGHKPEDDATNGATFGANIYGGSSSTNYINNNGYMTSITATSINTGTMNAARINGGDINGVTITGVTITGGILQTNSSSSISRVVIDDSTNDVRIYSGSQERIRLNEDTALFKDSSGITQGRIYASSGLFSVMNTRAGSIMLLQGPASATTSVLIQAGTGNSVMSFGTSGAVVRDNLSIYPAGTYGGSVGTASKVFSAMFATTYYFARGGETTRYIQMGSNGTVDCSGALYTARMKLPVGTNLYGLP